MNMKLNTHSLLALGKSNSLQWENNLKLEFFSSEKEKCILFQTVFFFIETSVECKLKTHSHRVVAREKVGSAHLIIS